MSKRTLIISSLAIILLIALTAGTTGCGVPRSDLDAANKEIASLQAELTSLKAVCPAGGFGSLSEFKDWISDHVQPGTTFIDDAFLAAYKVQQEGLADGYLFGLDVDTYEDSDDIAVYVTTFIGNELYWWFVEDVEEYGGLDLIR